MIVYRTLSQNSKDKSMTRMELFVKARQEGKSISEIARICNTERKTVRRWLKRYDENQRWESLRDRKRAPKKPHRRISLDVEFFIIEFKQSHKNTKRGYPFLRSYLLSKGVPKEKIPSRSTVYYIWRKNNLLKKHKTKREKKKDVREWKERLKPFEYIQVDIKELRDIPNYVMVGDVIKKCFGEKLPKYQITARDVKTGGLFIGYAHEKTLQNTTTFITLLLNHLRRYNIVPKYIQTDNGTEFANTRKPHEKTLFSRMVERFGSAHRLIPPRAKTYQSDVEVSHRLIEYEFYDCFDLPLSEKIKQEFLSATAEYQYLFNFHRQNSNRNYQTPCDILRNSAPDISEDVFHFYPFIADDIYPMLYENSFQTGSDVCLQIKFKKRASEHRLHDAPRPTIISQNPQTHTWPLT